MRNIIKNWCRTRKQQSIKSLPTQHPILESLEPRLLLSGTSYLVNSLDDNIADDNQLTLREAIQAANTNLPFFNIPAGSATEQDQITFDPTLFIENQATIMLDGDRLRIQDSLSIQAPNQHTLTIDADQQSQIFSIENSDNITMLANLNLINANADDEGDGGAISNDGSTLTINNLTLSNNVSETGGAIFNLEGTVNINNSTITQNQALHAGGAIVNLEHSTININNSTITHNNAPFGGAIYNIDDSTLNIQNSSISNNNAFQGGAIYSNEESINNIDNSTLNNNNAIAQGGALYLEYATLNISNSTLAHNSVFDPEGDDDGEGTGLGGALFVIDGIHEINHSNFNNNHAAYFGGAIFNAEAGIIINGSTFANNLALTIDIDEELFEGQGGAIHNQGEMIINNSVIIANSATFGGGINLDEGAFLAINNSTIVANQALFNGGGIHNPYDNFLLSNSIVTFNLSDSDANDITNDDFDSETNIISSDPRFVRNPSDGGDGYIDNPFTPLIDEAANNDLGDLRLQPTSPAINTGDNTELPPDYQDIDNDDDTDEPLPFDFANHPRIYAGIVDIGAHEYIQPADANYDTVVNLADLAALATNFGRTTTSHPQLNLGFTHGDFNLDGVINLADLAILATNFGNTFTNPNAPGGAVAESLLLNSENSNAQTPSSLNWNHINNLLDESESASLL